MPLAIDQPTLAIRVYEPNVRDGTRQPDLTIFSNAQFTRERNTVGSFQVTIPLVPVNQGLLEQVRYDWMFEFWSGHTTPEFLFGGYVTKIEWSIQDGGTALTVSGPSYLGWIAQRRLMGGTGSLAWAATLGGLETGGDPPAINEIMYHACTYVPYSLNPVGTDRTHLWFRIPNAPQITHVTDLFSTPTLTTYGIPRKANVEISAFMQGMEVLDYLSGLVGERINQDPSSDWFGMPRVSYDIVRYSGDPVVGPGSVVWPTGAIYLLFKIPGFGTNRTVGSDAEKPVIFDVSGGGVSEASYTEDVGEINNFVWGLGVGNKATRARYDFLDSDSMIRYGRIEGVVDAGQEANINIINQKVDDYLQNRKLATKTVRFTLNAIPGQLLGYDFQFDDAVTVYWDEIGLVLNDYVTSVTCSIGGSEDGKLGIQQVKAVIGSEKLARDSNVLGRYLSGQRRSLTNLRI